MFFSRVRSFCAALVLAGALASPATAADKLTYGVIGAGSAQQWPLWIAQEKGFFTEKNLEVDIIVTPSAAAVLQQIVAGALDVGTSGLTTPILAIDQGTPVAILGIETQVPPYSLWSKPNLTTMESLRGKIVIVGGAKDVTRTYLERMLAPSGVMPGQYDLIYAGSAASRFAALAAGGADAALLNPPTSFKAQAGGYKDLGNLTDFVEMPFTGYIASVAVAKSRKASLVAFAAALGKGVGWFEDDANRKEAIEIQQKASKASLEDVSATYDLYRKLKVFPRDGSLRVSKIETIIAAMKDSGELKGSTDRARFVNADVGDIFAP